MAPAGGERGPEGGGGKPKGLCLCLHLRNFGCVYRTKYTLGPPTHSTAPRASSSALRLPACHTRACFTPRGARGIL